MSTISISSTAGIVLGAAFTNPIDILPGVSITSTIADGVAASNYAWTITNAGYVAGTNNGFALTGGALTNTAGATIAGNTKGSGIYVRGGVESVTNYGSIDANNGIYDARGSSAITNAASAEIFGTYSGIVFYFGSGTVVNSGLLEAHQEAGVLLRGSGGLVSNSATGLIAGTNCGIEVREGGLTAFPAGTFDNAGFVFGSIGVQVGFINTVVNSGYINGSAANGINLDGSSNATLGVPSIVTNEAGGRIKGYISGVDVNNFNQTLINAGHITGVHEYGVRLGEASVVTNAASGTIASYDAAVDIEGTFTGAAGTVINYGSIGSTRGSVVRLAEGGTITNAAGGTMTGEYGAIILNNAGTLINDGFISGSAHEGMELSGGGLAVNDASGRVQDGFTGIFLGGDGSIINRGGVVGQTGQGIDTYNGLVTITNAASAYVNGAVGVNLDSGGTLLNAGDIVGTGGTAVSFHGFTRNLLGVSPGGHFQGEIVGSPSATNMLELQSGASTGVLSGIGSSITNFGTIAFDAGAQWQVSGNMAGFAGAITGFAPGDVIEVTGITVTGFQYFGGVLSLQEGDILQPVTISGNFGGEHFAVENVLAGAQISLACFALGTRVRTPDADIEVEDLRVGDLVMAHSGDGIFAPRPIVWIGHRSVDFRGSDARQVWPVRIAAGAFAPGRPARDLWLSPDHAVFVNGVLVPVRYLVNGASIAQVACDEITYFHIELAVHGVVLAEGLPCESYLDTGNRAAFGNGCEGLPGWPLVFGEISPP